jgi:hypothetical protein
MDGAFVNKQYLQKLIDFCIAFLVENGVEFAETFQDMETDFYHYIVRFMKTRDSFPGRTKQAKALLENIQIVYIATLENSHIDNPNKNIAWTVFDVTTANICYLYVAEAIIAATDDNDLNVDKFRNAISLDPELIQWPNENDKFVDILQFLLKDKNEKLESVFIASAKVDSKEKDPVLYSRRRREENKHIRNLVKESDELYNRTTEHPMYKILDILLTAVRTLHKDRSNLRRGSTSLNYQEIEDKFSKKISQVINKKNALAKELNYDRVSIRLYEEGKKNIREGNYKKLLDKVYPKIDFAILQEQLEEINRIAESKDLLGMYAFIYTQYGEKAKLHFIDKAYEDVYEYEEDEEQLARKKDDKYTMEETEDEEAKITSTETPAQSTVDPVAQNISAKFMNQMRQIKGRKAPAFVRELLDTIAHMLEQDASRIDARLKSHFGFLHKLLDAEKTQIQKKIFPVYTIRHIGKSRKLPSKNKMIEVVQYLKKELESSKTAEFEENYDEQALAEMDEINWRFELLIDAVESFENKWYSFFEELTALEDKKRQVVIDVFHHTSLLVAGEFLSSLNPWKYNTASPIAFIESIDGGVSLEALAKKKVFKESAITGIIGLSQEVQEKAIESFQTHLKEIYTEQFYGMVIENTWYFLDTIQYYYAGEQAYVEIDQDNTSLVETTKINFGETTASVLDGLSRHITNIIQDPDLALNDPEWEPDNIESDNEEFESEDDIFSLDNSDEETAPLKRLKRVSESDNPQSADKEDSFEIEQNMANDDEYENVF